jgi:F420-0:gamma-glutamyl ligase-like protein
VSNDYNAALFNIRTRSLNVLVYSISQIVGSLAMGSLLDQRRFSRRVRAFTGWAVLLVFLFIAYGWGYYFQR